METISNMTTSNILTKREQILEAENQLISAMKISDLKALDEMLHDDLLFITPDGQTITKAMDLDSHRSGTMIIEEILPVVELINIIDDTAAVTIHVSAKGKMLGQPIEGKFRYIRVWKLFTDSWKVIGGSCTQL